MPRVVKKEEYYNVCSSCKNMIAYSNDEVYLDSKGNGCIDCPSPSCIEMIIVRQSAKDYNSNIRYGHD